MDCDTIEHSVDVEVSRLLRGITYSTVRTDRASGRDMPRTKDRSHSNEASVTYWVGSCRKYRT